MKHAKRKNIGGPVIAVAFAVALLFGGMIGYFIGKGGNEIAGTALLSDVADLEQAIVDDAVVVQTDFGPLYYPARFQEFLRVEQERADGFTVVRYLARIDGENEYELFSVLYGKEGQMTVGSVLANDGPSVISLCVNEELPFDAWGEDEANLAYAMLEDMNYLTERLDEIDGFVRGA